MKSIFKVFRGKEWNDTKVVVLYSMDGHVTVKYIKTWVFPLRIVLQKVLSSAEALHVLLTCHGRNPSSYEQLSSFFVTSS